MKPIHPILFYAVCAASIALSIGLVLQTYDFRNKIAYWKAEAEKPCISIVQNSTDSPESNIVGNGNEVTIASDWDTTTDSRHVMSSGTIISTTLAGVPISPCRKGDVVWNKAGRWDCTAKDKWELEKKP